MIELTTEQTNDGARRRRMDHVLLDLAAQRKYLNHLKEDQERELALEADLKSELREVMEAIGIRTGEGFGLQAQLKTRKSTVVTDVTALTASLSEAGMLDDFLVLDKASAAKEAVKHGWDGVGVQETTYLSISEVKS